MIHCTTAADAAVALALQRGGLRWGKNLERCMWQGKANKPFVLLAHTVFLPACYRVISETKVEVGIELSHS